MVSSTLPHVAAYKLASATWRTRGWGNRWGPQDTFPEMSLDAEYHHQA